MCHFNTTQDSVLHFKESKSEIEEILYKTEIFNEYSYEADFRILINDIFDLSSNLDLKTYSTKIQKDSALEITELNQICCSFELIFEHLKVLFNYQFLTQESKDELFNIKRKLINNYIKPFRLFVEKDGTIDLSRHPLLKPLFQKQSQIESKIRSILNEKLTHQNFSEKIQFNTIDIVNDRYVIPIRSDNYNSQIGQIISRSDTGKTLYVELGETSQLNYQRIQVIVEIQNILSKLELNLTRELKDYIKYIYQFGEIIFEIDEYNTRNEFAKKYNLNRPTLLNDKTVKLYNSFHPLIENPIRNDISIDHSKKGLIISGPNTGGKTATLKTLALTQLLLRYGLFVPASAAEVHLYDKVYYFGNDQQNLEQGLSSFAAEVKNYTELLDSLAQTNLILIDEIFNSTSSEEASALAIAFFQKISSTADSHLVVSTHHQTLKTFLHQNKDYLSAHVGFDIDTNSPTYKLYYGAPGSSQALNIFQKITSKVPAVKNLYYEATKFLDNKIVHYEKLLGSLSQKENELNRLVRENNEINQQLKNQKKSMDGLVRLKVEEKVKETQIKLNKVYKQSQTLLKEIKSGNIQTQKAINKSLDQLNSQVKTLSPKKPDELPKERPNLAKPKKIEVGKEYFSLVLEKTVLVKKVDEKKKIAYIGSGHFSMKCPFKTLMLANKSSNSSQIDSQQAVILHTSRNESIEYDCRGMRLEEFQDTVESAIADLLLGNVPFINFIHGHGTGVLKKWLRKYIKDHKEITFQKNETGNDGETRIILK